MTRLRATSGSTTVSPPTAEAVARVVPMPELTVAGSPQAQAAHGGAQGRLVGRLGGGRPDAGARGGDRVRRGDLREEGLEAVDELLVLVQDVREVRVRGLVGDRVDGAPGGQGRDRHLGHEGQGLVAVQGAGEEVGGLDEEAQRAAAQALQLAQAGRLDGQRDAVGGELEAQGLLVGVPARGLGGDAEGAREAALDLQRDRDDRAHARAVEQRDGAGDGREVVVDGGHAGRAVAAGARLHGDAGEALAGGGEARWRRVPPAPSRRRSRGAGRRSRRRACRGRAPPCAGGGRRGRPGRGSR